MTPKSNWKKSRLQDSCREYGIAFNDSDTKVILWSLLKEYIAKNVKPTAVMLAEDAGHEVLYLPPYHSDLQPIETVWAVVKGEVGRKYTTDTTFAQVLQRLQQAFNNITTKTVQGCINSSESELTKLWKHMQDQEKVDEGEYATSDDKGDDDDDKDDSSGDENNDFQLL